MKSNVKAVPFGRKTEVLRLEYPAMLAVTANPRYRFEVSFKAGQEYQINVTIATIQEYMFPKTNLHKLGLVLEGDGNLQIQNLHSSVDSQRNK